MGLLDGLVKSAVDGALGNTQTSPTQILQVIGSLLQRMGGVEGLIKAFNQAGLGNIIGSWISNAHNLPISANQLTQVLGSDTLSNVAQQLGVDAGQAGSLLAKFLPEAVNHLTPQGDADVGNLKGELLTSALGALQGKLFG